MSICQREERAAGRPYPRTCPTCKLGPCSRSTMTTDPKDAEIARYDLDLMESRMVKDQWGGEWVRHSDHATEIARLTAELRVYMDAAEAHAVETMRQRDRAEKAEAERDAALAQVAGDGYRLQKQRWFVETGWCDSGGMGYWTQTNESVEVETEAEAKALQDRWLAEGKLQYMPWGEIRPTFSYGLFRIRRVWQDVSPTDAIAARDRRDAQLRAEAMTIPDTDTLETCQHILKFTLTDAKCVEGDDE